MYRNLSLFGKCENVPGLKDQGEATSNLMLTVIPFNKSISVFHIVIQWVCYKSSKSMTLDTVSVCVSVSCIIQHTLLVFNIIIIYTGDVINRRGSCPDPF